MFSSSAILVSNAVFFSSSSNTLVDTLSTELVFAILIEYKFLLYELLLVSKEYIIE